MVKLGYSPIGRRGTLVGNYKRNGLMLKASFIFDDNKAPRSKVKLKVHVTTPGQQG